MKKQLAVLTILLALVVLPALGQTAAKPASTPASAASTTKSSTAAADKIDINSASKEELMKLDGVGEAISAKIIAGRPYKTKRDLLTQKIVNQATYTKISDKIIAHAPKSTTAAAKPTAATPAKAK
jgi:DNA uptake protein ComE-like DNA-binding protein